MSVAGDHLDEGELERLELVEAAARLLVEAYDEARDSAYPALVQVAGQVAQLRSALEGRASSSPAPGGGGTPAA